jgi:hypothetical protein
MDSIMLAEVAAEAGLKLVVVAALVEEAVVPATIHQTHLIFPVVQVEEVLEMPVLQVLERVIVEVLLLLEEMVDQILEVEAVAAHNIMDHIIQFQEVEMVVQEL